MGARLQLRLMAIVIGILVVGVTQAFRTWGNHHGGGTDAAYIHLMASVELQHELQLNCEERIKLEEAIAEASTFLTRCASNPGTSDSETVKTLDAQMPLLGAKAKAALTPEHVARFIKIAGSYPAPISYAGPATVADTGLHVPLGTHIAAYRTVRFTGSAPAPVREATAGPHRTDMATTDGSLNGNSCDEQIMSVGDAVVLLHSDEENIRALGASWLSAVEPNGQADQVLDGIEKSGWETGGGGRWRGAFIAAYMRWSPDGRQKVAADKDLLREAVPFLLSDARWNVEGMIQPYMNDDQWQAAVRQALQQLAQAGDPLLRQRADSLIRQFDIAKRMADQDAENKRRLAEAQANAEAARQRAMAGIIQPPGHVSPGGITPPVERPIDVAFRQAETGSDFEKLSAIATLLRLPVAPSDIPRLREVLLKNAGVQDTALWNQMLETLKKILQPGDAAGIAARLGGAEPVDGRVRLAMLLVAMDIETATSGFSTVENDTVFLQRIVAPLKGLGEAGEDSVLALMRNPGPRVESTMALVLDAIGTSKSLPALNTALRNIQPGPAGSALRTNATRAVQDITQRRSTELTAHPEERAAAEKALAAVGVKLDPKATPDQILALLAKADQAKEVIAAGFKVDVSKATMAQILEMQTRMDLTRQINAMIGTKYLAPDYQLAELKVMRDKAPLVKDLAALGMDVNINAMTRQELESLRTRAQLAVQLKTTYGITVDAKNQSEDDLRRMLSDAKAKAKP